MCDVWESIGESVDRDLVNTLYNRKYLDNLVSDFDTNEVTKLNNTVVTEENEEQIVNAVALLKKSTTVNFVANTAKFLDSSEATEKLDEFIEIANVLDGSIIQIEGNIASDNDSASGVALSKQRADTVKQYFVLNGISADRIVTVGNGGKCPVAPNDSEENMQLNRRTDISFKCVE
jgi:outer membrane protein OmpA-like peptidoglycan-associated protein